MAEGARDGSDHRVEITMYGEAGESICPDNYALPRLEHGLLRCKDVAAGREESGGENADKGAIHIRHAAWTV